VCAGALELHTPGYTKESGEHGWGLVLPGSEGSGFVDPYSHLYYTVRTQCLVGPRVRQLCYRVFVPLPPTATAPCIVCALLACTTAAALETVCVFMRRCGCGGPPAVCRVFLAVQDVDGGLQGPFNAPMVYEWLVNELVPADLELL
jgi:hypothetical protein